MDIKGALNRIVNQLDLTTEEMQAVMRQIMTGQCTDAQIGAFLMGMRMKSETIDEIVGAVAVMRELADGVQLPTLKHVVDVVGTGGDGANIFNVSSAASFVVAAAGGKVAKHGNRAVSGKSGSADLLEAAGIYLELTSEQVARCIDTVGVGFMFAQVHHKAMKYAAGPRRELGLRTLFNMLGPLTNPAGVRHQVVGVFTQELCKPLAEVLKRLGSEHVLVVHSRDGLDEFSLAAATHIAELKDGEVREYEVRPEDFGIKSQTLMGLEVDSPQASLELIRRRLDDARSTDLIDGALQSAERARNLVGRLLTFARRQTLKPQAVALRELVEGMHDLIERSLGPTIEVRIEIPERLPAVVVDPHQFELAILNLAVNARDAMGEGGRLEIGARTDLVIDGAVDGLGAGRYVCLEVADNGGGMPAEVLARCMEPFFSTKGVGKGTGLGLSMVQGLVAQSGGGLGIHSEIGKGTRVSIWLPITAEQTQSTAESCPDAPEASRPTHVLLVDDDRMVRYTTALLLGDLGYQVSEAASAEEALGEVERGLAPDLLVTDHLMADKTGVQLAEELRQHFPQLPVLVITGYANLRPEQLNGFEVLTKPFRHNELAERLARLLEASP